MRFERYIAQLKNSQSYNGIGRLLIYATDPDFSFLSLATYKRCNEVWLYDLEHMANSPLRPEYALSSLQPLLKRYAKAIENAQKAKRTTFADYALEAEIAFQELGQWLRESIAAARDGKLPFGDLTPTWDKGMTYLYIDWIWEIESRTADLYTPQQVRHQLDAAVDKLRKKIERNQSISTIACGQSPTRRREPIPEEVRIYVWRRDLGRCAKCGSDTLLEFDHIIPVSRGGSNTARNIQILCSPCNKSKSDNI